MLKGCILFCTNWENQIWRISHLEKELWKKLSFLRPQWFKRKYSFFVILSVRYVQCNLLLSLVVNRYHRWNSLFTLQCYLIHTDFNIFICASSPVQKHIFMYKFISPFLSNMKPNKSFLPTTQLDYRTLLINHIINVIHQYKGERKWTE